MKPSLLASFILGVTIASMPLVGRDVQSTQAPPESQVATSSDSPGLAVGSELAETNNVLDVESAPVSEISNSAGQPGSKEKPLPANVRPSGPVAEVIKLADSGLDQSVMVAFVTNSTSTFNLGPEEIIYLNDIGMPSAVVTAMIQRDQVLRNASAAAPRQPTASNAVPIAPFPTPEQVAPQPAEMAATYPSEPPPGPEPAADGGFYDSLAPYGNWVDVGGYGWCWQPTVVTVNPYWQPYFDCGHWVYSDCGWYWNSRYSWGWAPFHYGRWFRHHQLGWCWMPGTMWGPSWVSWRYTDAYCGWAPLPPGASFTFGVGLTFHGHHVGDHDDCGLRPDHYHFVAWNHFTDRQLEPHRLSPNDSAHVFDRATVATRVSGDGRSVINHGLPPTRVVAATRTPIHTVTLRETTTASGSAGRQERFVGNDRTLQVYRPQMPATTANASTVPHSSVNPRIPVAAADSKASGPPIARVAPRDAQLHSQQSAPLVLHGSQPWTPVESPAPSSLVIIGRRDANGRPIGTTTITSGQISQNPPATTSVRPAPSRQNSTEAQMTPPQTPTARPSVNQNWQPNTPWLESQNQESSTRFYNNAPAPRTESPRYQPQTRPVYPEVPRYAPSYMPQRSYSAPSMPAQSRSPVIDSRPAPPAPSAPAAPPARSAPAPSAPSSSAQPPAGRNSR
jgi:hypothetical protein